MQKDAIKVADLYCLDINSDGKTIEQSKKNLLP